MPMEDFSRYSAVKVWPAEVCSGSTTGVVSVTVELWADLDGGGVATPQLSPGGGTYAAYVEVALTTPTAGAAIHYTLDGSDPRLVGGGVNPDATQLDGGTIVRGKARSIAIVAAPRRVEHHRPCGVGFGAAVGEHGLDELVLGDRLAELLPALCEQVNQFLVDNGFPK